VTSSPNSSVVAHDFVLIKTVYFFGGAGGGGIGTRLLTVD
jgi:hypothetical protein